jgi:hypothetical protein
MDESRDSGIFTPFRPDHNYGNGKNCAPFYFSCFHSFRVGIFPYSENKCCLLRTGFSAAEVSRTDGSEAVQTLIYSTNANICSPCTLSAPPSLPSCSCSSSGLSQFNGPLIHSRRQQHLPVGRPVRFPCNSPLFALLAQTSTS